jgi:hypothetical protein
MWNKVKNMFYFFTDDIDIVIQLYENYIFY